MNTSNLKKKSNPKAALGEGADGNQPSSSENAIKQLSVLKDTTIAQDAVNLGNGTGDPNNSDLVLSTNIKGWEEFEAKVFSYAVKSPESQKHVVRPKPLLIHINDMLAQKHEVNWLIKGIFEAETLNMIFGDPAGGKSFLAVDMACCIATGMDWHGNKVKAGRVIYIAGEGNRGYASRCRAWSIQNGVDLNNAPLVFSNKTVSFSDLDSVDSFDAETIEMLKQSDDHVALIIFDTLARTMDGDENSTQDMARFIAKLDQLKAKYNCAILLVHHTGHGDKQRARGSTVLKGALDSEYRLTKDRDGTIRFECTKMKESEAPPSMSFVLTDVLLPDLNDEGELMYKAAIESISYVEPAKTKTKALGANQSQALKVLNEIIQEQTEIQSDDGFADDWVSAEDWKQRLETEGMDSKRFSEVRKSLHNAGLIKFDDQGYVQLCAASSI